MFLTRVSALVGQLLPLIGKKETISQVDSTKSSIILYYINTSFGYKRSIRAHTL